MGITITEAARNLGVSRKTLSEIVNGRCSLTPEIAVRIGKATNTSPESWLAMQSKLDLWKATLGLDSLFVALLNVRWARAQGIAPVTS